MGKEMKYRYTFITEKLKDEFSSKYIEKKSGCWDWKNYTDSDGYGQIHLKYDDGKSNVCRAHRISWMIYHQSDWPANKPHARHTCNNPSCVNPAHIIPGTEKENSQDMIISGRRRFTPTYKAVHTPFGTYSSMTEAAASLNVIPETIRKRIKKKWEGYSYV